MTQPVAVSGARIALPSRVLIAVGASANVATLAWASVALVVSGRGLGLGNEGFYLLAYRNWATNPRTFTGSQYLYGPLLELLGGDIGLLRVCRLALVLAVHLGFGLSVVRWLRVERPDAIPDSATAYCGASLITATGAILYGWLPPTPGYNDITTLGALVLLSAVLSSLRTAASGRSIGPGAGLVYGCTAAAMLLAKPPAVFALVVIGAGTIYALRLAGARGIARFAVWCVGGAALFGLVIQTWVARWTAIVPPIRAQIAVVSAHSHPPLEVLRWYVSTTLTVLEDGLIICAPLLVILLVGVLAHWSAARRLVAGMVGLLASVTLAVAIGGLHSGGGNVLAFSSTIFAMLLIVLATSTSTFRALSSSGRVVAIGLLVVPALQGFGTNNALYAVAVNGAAAWVALMFVVVIGSRSRWRLPFVLPAAAMVTAVTVAVVVGLDGVSHDGSGQRLLAGPMDHVAGVPELASLVLPQTQAIRLSAFRSDLGDLVVPDRPMLAFGDIAQYVLLLGGHPIGESWYSADDDGLNRADLEAACRHGNPWGSLQPLVVASRAPSDDELTGWRGCGVDFTNDYRDVTPSSAPPGIRVLAPRDGFQPVDHR